MIKNVIGLNIILIILGCNPVIRNNTSTKIISNKNQTNDSLLFFFRCPNNAVLTIYKDSVSLLNEKLVTDNVSGNSLVFKYRKSSFLKDNLFFILEEKQKKYSLKIDSLSGNYILVWFDVEKGLLYKVNSKPFRFD